MKRLIEGKGPYLLIAVLGILIYGWSMSFGFTYLDDNVLVLDNLYFLSNLANIVESFKIEVFHVLHASAAYYRPMLTISFILDAQLSGESPIGYHLTNIVIHILTAGVLFNLLKRMKYRKEVAVLAAMVFLVHPVLTQAVVWIPGRNDSLLGLFILVSFSYFLKYVKSVRSIDLGFHFIFFGAALFTKESAGLITLLCLFYLQLIVKEELISERKAKLVTGWALAGAVWYGMRSVALVSAVDYSPMRVIESVVGNFAAVLLYLGKVFIPVNLSVLPTLQDSSLVWGWVSLLVLIILMAITKGKRYAYLVFGVSWFMLFLVPSFVRPNTFYVADFIEHRLYTSMTGLLIVLAEIEPLKSIRLGRKREEVIALGLVLILGMMAVWHSRVYKDQISFWTDAVENSPSHPLAHKNLGAMYYLDGNFEEAERRYKKALELNPVEQMVHNNLGLIYMAWGEDKLAEEEYKKELEINPMYDKAHYNYGVLLVQRGEMEKAKEMWLKTIRINPDHADALRNLAVLYHQLGEEDRANYYYQEAVKRGVKF